LTVSLAKLQEVREEDTSAQAGRMPVEFVEGGKPECLEKIPFLLAGIELGPHWWEVSVPTTTPSLPLACITHVVPFFLRLVSI